MGFNNVITVYNGYGRKDFINKNLNYTAFSRAKDNVYIFGKSQFYSNNNMIDRNTLLEHFLNDNVKIIDKKLVESSFQVKDSKMIINDCVKKRKPIPKAVRVSVFEKRHGEDVLFGKCYVCEKKINKLDFEVGHVVSVFNNGSNCIDNLEPICRGCNLSMGKENLEHYKKTYYNK